MAEIDTLFFPTPEMFPWSVTAAPNSAISGIKPLGAMTTVTRDGTIALTGVGDVQMTQASVVLPANFLYALTDIAVMIHQATLPAAMNWESTAQLTWFDTIGGLGSSQTMEFGIGMDSTLVKENGTVCHRVYRAAGPLPTFLLVGGGSLNAVFNNLTSNDVAATFNYVARFLVYTVDQQFDAGVNTPLLTR
jgi:hypothetical protein